MQTILSFGGLGTKGNKLLRYDLVGNCRSGFREGGIWMVRNRVVAVILIVGLK